MIRRSIPTYDDQIVSLGVIVAKKGKKLTTEEAEKFKETYERVLKMVEMYVPKDGPDVDADVSIGLFQDTGGYQIIMEGAVFDRKKPLENKYNWHLQNTSQWLFAFGVVFDTERRNFSMHT
jgi:hypothetical protein